MHMTWMKALDLKNPQFGSNLMIDDAYHNDQEPSSNELGFHSTIRSKVKTKLFISTKYPWLGFHDANHQIKDFKPSIKLYNQLLSPIDTKSGFLDQVQTHKANHMIQ